MMEQNRHSLPAGLLRRLASLALAVSLALGLAGCEDALAALQDAAAAPSSSTAQPVQPAAEGAFSVNFIDVGQALSVLVTCDGQSMLYDGGNVEDGSLVVSYLQSKGVSRLEYVICSHAHEDHVGGLAAVLAKFPAGHVYAPVAQADTQCFSDFVKYAQQQGLAVEVPSVGTSWQLGSATVQIIGPVAQYDDTNDTSLVVRIDYGQTSFLLTGDMEQDAEDDLVASGAPVDVDVLQVGHHGSETSTGYVFLNAVLPEVGVISVGTGNSYACATPGWTSGAPTCRAPSPSPATAPTTPSPASGMCRPSSRTPPPPMAAASRAAAPRPSRPISATSTPKNSICPAARTSPTPPTRCCSPAMSRRCRPAIPPAPTAWAEAVQIYPMP